MVAGKISPTGGILSGYKLGFTELSQQYNNNALVHDEWAGVRVECVLGRAGGNNNEIAGSFD